MTEDILTVMWKESKGLLRYNTNRWKSILTLITPIALFGIIFPIQFREEWLTSNWSLAVAVVTPMLLIASTISESFAGERERHTLETLLASRLPDQAILLGKLFMSVLFGWGMTLFLLLVSLGVVNILEWNGDIQFYSMKILWINLTASLLMSGLVANLGILISLRSPTVQNAAQMVMLMLFMPLLLLQAVVFLLPSFVPIEPIKAFLEGLDVESIILIILLVLLVANIGLFLGARARFKRSKLILS
jgi:ABC-2 type transport system permease protein